MNPYLIFGIVALAAFGMLVLGKVFAGIGLVVLFIEAILFAFFVLFKGDSDAPQGPSQGPKL